MKDKFDKLIKKIDKYALKKLTESRYEHSVRVARYAEHLANLYKDEKVEPKKAYFTGFAHDICKHHSDEKLVEIVTNDKLGIDEIEKNKLNLLHGRAAAVVLKKKFGIEDISILHAVAFHTFGYVGIDALGKIIYIADKIEPERSNMKNFRDIAGNCKLNFLMVQVISDNMEYVKSKGGIVHPFTEKMYLQIRKELDEK